MNQIIKKETNDNIVIKNPHTFDNTDRFNRKEFAERLTKVIETFYPFYDEAFVLSLNGKYGTGKSTFLDMWANYLQSKEHNVIRINAWETDFDEEPLIPIISNILDSISNNDVEQPIKLALKAALVASVLAGNAYAEKITGINIKNIVEDTNKFMQQADIQSIGNEIYKEFSFKEKAYKILKSQLEKYIEQLDGKPLIIFVDELDRVRPDYAVKFLEAIKHIFSVQGLVFVLAVDRAQLEKSIKQLYGDIDFKNYYLRFITRETDLPSNGEISWDNFIKQTTNEYFTKDFPLRLPIAETEIKDVLKFINMYAVSFSLTPREVENVIRSFFQLISIERDKTTNYLLSYLEIILFLTVLHFKDRNMYHQIGMQKVSPDEINDYINNLNFTNLKRSDKRHILLTVMAFLINEENEDAISRIVSIHEGAKPDTAEFEKVRQSIIFHLYKIAGNNHRMGFDPMPIINLYNKIEKWEEFL